MMYKLSWDQFEWKQFELLTLHLAENIIPECNFEQYLKQGNEQQGIDLISVQWTNGRNITIQSKREKELSETDIDEIITKFFTGTFAKSTSRFILSTSADLQNEKLSASVIKHKKDLKANNIDFECWDVNFIQEHLRGLWNIVSYFFDVDQADKFCFPQVKLDTEEEIEQIQNFLPRSISEYNKTKLFTASYNFLNGPKELDLADLFLSNRLQTKRICITGDAYQGKSTYVKETTLRLKNSGQRIQPFFIETKKYNIKPIESLLTTIYRSWKNIPLKDIIVVIDGLDEAPTDRFGEMMKYIYEFSLSFSSVSILVSCRTLFFNYYNVNETLRNFELYQLNYLSEASIYKYLDDVLGEGLKSQFIQKLGAAGLATLLRHPFYLTNLVEDFKYHPSTALKNRFDIVEKFIEKEFEKSRNRPTEKSTTVNQTGYQFKLAIKKLALAFQIANVNAFTFEQIDQLFSSNEKLLLQHNSLVTTAQDTWSFSNALFQETLAANALASLNYSQIISLCSLGINIKKIKTRWVQTITLLLSNLESSDPLFEQLIKFVEADNIELLFQVENSSFSDEFRLAVFKKLMERCVRLNIRPMVVYEESIASFVENSDDAIDLLLDYLNNGEMTELIKILCCRILRNLTLDEKFKSQFLTIVFDQLSQAKEINYSSSLVEIFTCFGTIDEDSIQTLIGFTDLNSEHEFRNQMYELLVHFGLVEKYYDYGLQGFETFIQYNTDTRRIGSETRLEAFLLKTERIAQLKQLFARIEDERWRAHFARNNVINDNFLTRLCDLCSSIYKNEPIVAILVGNYVRTLGRNYLREEFKEFDKFFDKTQTQDLIVRLLINDLFGDRGWLFGDLITPRSFDYIMFEYEEGDFDIKKLRTLVNSLHYNRKFEASQKFEKLCEDAIENNLYTVAERSASEEYQKAEKKKRENDLVCIKSLDNFKKAIEGYFAAFGKKSINEDDLYIGEASSWDRKNADSTFVFTYLRDFGRNKKVYLRDAIEPITIPGQFEAIRVDLIFTYNYQTDETKKVLDPIIKDYYLSKLPFANFSNCKWIENNQYFWRVLENQLGEIFKKYEFDTLEPFLIEMVWLDTGGLSNYHNARINNSESFTQKIAKQLTTTGIDKLKRKVVENLKIGIKLDTVLGNHIGLCKYYKISEAKDEILKVIENYHGGDLHLPEVADIYLELGGSELELVRVFKNMTHLNNHLFVHLASKLSSKNQKVVAPRLLECLGNSDVLEVNQVTFARILSQLGIIEGFKYLVDYLDTHDRAPFTIQGEAVVNKIDTNQGLTLIAKHIHIIIEDERRDIGFPETHKGIVIEWINGFAAKGESDLVAVIKLLQEQQQALKETKENSVDFNWYINRVLENFRSTDTAPKPISEIASFLSTISFN